jgi:hypothetical protein
MAQVNWIYLDNNGGRHSVGLYHGDRSHHLMIYCNNKVVQIDFSVKDSKTYSFFIEDEFCEIILEKMPKGHFGYEFRVNKTIDTPRNRIRKIDNRRNNRKLAWLIAGVVLFLAAVFFGLQRYGQSQELKLQAKTNIFPLYSKANQIKLMREGKGTVSYLHLEELNSHRIGVYTFKLPDSSEVRGTFSVADTGLVLLPNGFPLHTGDAFETSYLPANPEVHRVELYRPTKSTISSYILHAFEVEQHANPGETKEKNLCKVLTIAENQSWNELANIIFQNFSPAQNPRHNRESYLRMVRNPQLEKVVRERCWDE